MIPPSTATDAWTGAAQAYAACYTAWLDMGLKTTAAIMRAGSEYIDGAETTSGAQEERGAARESIASLWAFPELPASGVSWYREPTVHPFTAMADEMMRAWRTAMMDAAMFGRQDQPGLAALAGAPWMGLTAMSFFVDQALGKAPGADQALSMAPSYRNDSGFAVANIYFPDDTQVTDTSRGS